MKENIAILTTSDFPYLGAPESFVRQMALGLKKNGVDVEVIRFWGDRYSNTNDLPIKLSNYLFKKPFKNEFLKFIETLMLVLFIPIFVAFQKLIKRNQVIIMYGLDRAYFVFPLTMFSKLFKIKCYRIITEIYPSYLYASKWWRKPNVLFNNLQVKYFDRYLNGIIVLSHFLKEMSLENGVHKNKLILIPHFIDLKLKAKNNKEKENFSIGFCGNPSIENGIIDLIKAIILLSKGKTSNIKLGLIGKISTDVAKIIRELNVDKQKIHFTGLLTKDEVNRELQNYQVLVNPRRLSVLADSGFPTKLGEYFATKKPIISTSVGDLPFYFTDKKEIVFAEPNNPKSLANAILYLYNNRKKVKEIGLNGYKWACDNLDYVENAKRLIDFLNK